MKKIVVGYLILLQQKDEGNEQRWKIKCLKCTMKT
jgi:hypothetical protein